MEEIREEATINRLRSVGKPRSFPKVPEFSLMSLSRADRAQSFLKTTGFHLHAIARFKDYKNIYLE